jgi:FMN-dependent NADH-azoreductase
MMPRLLYVQASPRDSTSTSSDAAGAFLKALGAHRLDVTIDPLDLWRAELPEFSGAMIASKYAALAGRSMDSGEAAAWRRITAMVDRLKSADGVVIATPMWNFGIPYKLKHWIDLITQPSLTFSFNPETGYAPLLLSRPTLVILSSAGDYATGTSRGRPDLATPYLKAALGFNGLSDVTFIPVGPTVGPADGIEAARDQARVRLSSLAGSFMMQRQSPERLVNPQHTGDTYGRSVA